jgi:pyrimidine operon attenuation protein / uracil phosphoribosyltransferase
MAREHERQVMDSERIALALSRMAHQIIESNKGLSNVVLIGIADGGIPITNRLKSLLESTGKKEIPTGLLDITLYRDDLTINDQPELKNTEIGFDLDGKSVVLVDDVLFTGRTVRAAITALVDFGRPVRIQLAVLVDRGHRELPIAADFVGKILDTEKNEKVLVEVSEVGGKKDKVVTSTPLQKQGGDA